MRLTALALLLVLAIAGSASAAPALVELGRFSSPTWAGSPPGDEERVFVTEQAGRIAVIRGGAASTFMDLTGSVQSSPGNERGLLSLAFPADYARSGKLYAFVTARSDGRIEVREYTGDDARSARVLVSVPHPDAANHNGGQLQFGPDGLLYAGIGDGGGNHDQFGHSQDVASRLGKLLRIDVVSGVVEQLSVGLRNPWRFSFHPDGRIIIADVGEGAREEINVGLAANYGWPCLEGTRPGPRADGRCATGTLAPVLEKTHGAPDSFCSIVGGYVVRDPGLPTLRGRYLYGDYCNPGLRSVDLADPAGDAAVGLTVPALSSFGEDACGRILVVSLTGPVSRIADGAASPCGPREPSPTPEPGPSPSPGATASPAPQPAAPTPPGPAAARPCVVSMRVTGLRSLAKRRYLSVALRSDKACRVALSARRFKRVVVRLKPGERRVVKFRRTRGAAKRITITARVSGASYKRTVRAR